MKRASSPLKAFTLIELLASVAVVSILGALLLSAIGRGGSQARATACLANLRQVHGGFLAYAQENNGELPAINVRNAEGTRWMTWWLTLAPYLERVNQYGYPLATQCPEVRKLAGKTLSRADARDLPTYAMNEYLGDYQVGTTPPPGRTVRLQNVAAPSKVILAGDAGVGGTATIANLNPVTVARQGDKHPLGSNLLWLDGHVTAWKGVERLAADPYKPGGSEDVWTP